MSFPVLTSDKSIENYTYECAGYDVAYKDTYFDIYREKAFKQHLPKDISFVDELTANCQNKYPIEWGNEAEKNKLLYLAGFNNGQLDGGEWGSMHRTADFQDKTIELIKENIKWTKIGAIASICSCVLQVASIGVQTLTYSAVKSQISIMQQSNNYLAQILTSNKEMRDVMLRNEADREIAARINRSQTHLRECMDNEFQKSIGDKLDQIQKRKAELRAEAMSEILHKDGYMDAHKKVMDQYLNKVDNVYFKDPVDVNKLKKMK